MVKVIFRSIWNISINFVAGALGIFQKHTCNRQFVI